MRTFERIPQRDLWGLIAELVQRRLLWLSHDMHMSNLSEEGPLRWVRKRKEGLSELELGRTLRVGSKGACQHP